MSVHKRVMKTQKRRVPPPSIDIKGKHKKYQVSGDYTLIKLFLLEFNNSP